MDREYLWEGSKDSSRVAKPSTSSNRLLIAADTTVVGSLVAGDTGCPWVGLRL